MVGVVGRDPQGRRGGDATRQATRHGDHKPKPRPRERPGQKGKNVNQLDNITTVAEAQEPKLDPVVYVGTFAPIVAHIQHPLMTDRTLCGCRIRWWLRPHQVEAMGVCHSCQEMADQDGGE